MTDPAAGALLIVAEGARPDGPAGRLVDPADVAAELAAEEANASGRDEVGAVVRARVARLLEDGRTVAVVATTQEAKRRWEAYAAAVPAPCLEWRPGTDWPPDWEPPAAPRAPRLDLLLDRFPATGVRESLPDLARRVDATGFGRLFLMDHLRQIPVLGEADDPLLETWTTLGALALATERVRLGPLVSQPVTRHPALIAKAATTLDVLSDGRAVLGLGAGAYEWEMKAFGFNLPPPGERVERLADAIEVCRAMWRADGDAVTGRHYRLADTRTAPRPRAGSIPIIVGGQGERLLGVAARAADGVNLFGGPRRVAAGVARVRAVAAAAARDPAEIEITWLARVTPLPVNVAALRRPGASMARTLLENGVADPAAARDRLARLGAAGVDTAIVVLPPIWTAGYLEQAAAALSR